jgi:hypothetical protein
MPAATMSDMCVCVGPPDTIVLGSTGVFIGGKPAARMGDQCAHGGAITVGMPTVLIGEVGSGGGAKTVSGGMAAMPVKVLIEVMNEMPIALQPQINTLALFKNAAASVSKHVDPTRDAQCREPEEIKKDYIRFNLRDSENKPVADVAYSLELPDGRVVNGKSNSNGVIEHQGIKSGTCKLTLIDLDASEWTA